MSAVYKHRRMEGKRMVKQIKGYYWVECIDENCRDGYCKRFIAWYNPESELYPFEIVGSDEIFTTKQFKIIKKIPHIENIEER